MEANFITSVDNKKIKNLIKIKNDFLYRYENNLCFLEGERLIFDTPKDFICEIFIRENYEGKILDKYIDIKKYILSEKVFNKIKSTENSQGIIAVAKYDNFISIDDINSDTICLDGVRDPGNIGTIIRMAEASGFKYIILSKDCCDITAPKVIRASMSSFFRMKFLLSNDLKSDILYLKNKNFQIVATSSLDSKKYYDLEYKNNIVFIFGNEANGISDEVKNVSNDFVNIPMSGEIESLNVSISAAIICFYIKRIRDGQKK